jgi:DNA-binding transcriptional LysR family regulator
MFLALKAVSGIRCEILDQDRLVLVAAPKHPLAEKRPVTARELAHARFVIGLRNSRFFRMTDAALKHIGVTSYDIAMEVQESNATKEMVRRGSAIACLPISAVAAELNDGSLVSLSLGSPLPQPNLYCGYMTPLSELARSLMKCLHVKTTLCA